MTAQLTKPWRELLPLHVSLIPTTVHNGFDAITPNVWNTQSKADSRNVFIFQRYQDIFVFFDFFVVHSTHTVPRMSMPILPDLMSVMQKSRHQYLSADVACTFGCLEPCQNKLNLQLLPPPLQ